MTSPPEGIEFYQFYIKYEGHFWEVVKAKRNTKIYRRIKGADPAIQFPKNLPSIYSLENSKTKEPQGLKPYPAEDATRKLNGPNGSRKSGGFGPISQADEESSPSRNVREAREAIAELYEEEELS